MYIFRVIIPDVCFDAIIFEWSGMNKIYKSVYVEHLGTWVAVSELSAAKGKRSGSVRQAVAGGSLTVALGVMGINDAAALSVSGGVDNIIVGTNQYPATAIGIPGQYNAIAVGA